MEQDREPGFGAPTEYDTALHLNAVGVYGEKANCNMFNRVFQEFCVRWFRFKPRGIYGLPDLEVHHFGRPAFLRADPKTNIQKYDINYLQVTARAHDDWAYILSYIENFPTICSVGWCTGKVAKLGELKALNPNRPPSFNTPFNSELLRPMKELRKYGLELERQWRETYGQPRRLAKGLLLDQDRLA